TPPSTYLTSLSSPLILRAIILLLLSSLRLTLSPYTTLFRSSGLAPDPHPAGGRGRGASGVPARIALRQDRPVHASALRRAVRDRSEEHTSELQSRSDFVWRLLLEIKKLE